MFHLVALIAHFVAQFDRSRSRRLDVGRPVRPPSPPPAADDVESWDRLREKRQRAYVERLTQ